MELNMRPTLKQFLQDKTFNAKKKSIPSTIQCKSNESPPQSGNYETSNIQEHNCEAKWDELQSSYIL